MNHRQRERFMRIQQMLPSTYRVFDTGAPRGERRTYEIRGADGERVAEANNLGSLEREVTKLRPNTK